MAERYTTARIQGGRAKLDPVAAFLGLDAIERPGALEDTKGHFGM